MIDYYGNWIEEQDYNKYPKEKWCGYDYIAVWIRDNGYEPKTTMENLITMIFLHYESALESEEFYGKENYEFNIDCCKEYVLMSGGFKEFDYYC